MARASHADGGRIQQYTEAHRIAREKDHAQESALLSAQV
jgi:hypothetical protein